MPLSVLINKDLSNIQEVLQQYDEDMKGFRKAMKIDMKTYAKANSEQAGLLQYYSEVQGELGVLYKDMDTRLKEVRAVALKKLKKISERSLTEKLLLMEIEADPDVVAHNKALREIEERQKKVDSIVEGMHQRGYTLNNMTRIRIGGFQDEYMYVQDEA